MYCNINKILIKHKNEFIKIKDHPYYQALKNNDPKIYENTIKLSKTQSSKNTGSWMGFLNLKDVILEHGIHYVCQEELIQIKKLDDINFYCHHGRHRLCILYFLYYTTIKLKIENNLCIGFKIKYNLYTTIKIKLK